MPHDDSQPIPTVRPDVPTPTEPPGTVRSGGTDPSTAPLLRLDGPAAPPGFALADELGRGGMGVVYAARDAEVGREVAVKLLRPEYVGHSSAAKRFVEEARITGQLQHPGIPPVYRVGTLPDGSPFLAMKLVKGRTLSDLLRDRASPATDRGRFVAIFEGICQAVGYAHAHGVIHRDLKPQNVMVGAFGEVQVMDWGLAKVLTSGGVHPRRFDPSTDTAPDTVIRSDRDAGDETQAGSHLGTPAYMPPEQAIGAIDKIDARSDVFGLGGILCAVLTGKPPYVGESGESTRQLAAQGKLADAFARLAATDADPRLVALCRQCLSVEKADRPADGNAVAAAVAGLRAAADERARQAEVAKATGDTRRRVLAWAAAAVVAVFAVGAGVSLWQMVRANGEAERADAARRDEADQRQAADAARAQAEASAADERKATARAVAVLGFFQEKVLSAGQPTGHGGLGREVSLRKAVDAAEPEIGKAFAADLAAEGSVRNVLGTTYYYLGEMEKAAEQYRKATDLRTKALGPTHRDTLQSRYDLASALGPLPGRGQEAIDLEKETLRLRKEALGPDDPDTLLSMANLASFYRMAGQNGSAVAISVEAADALARVRGPLHFEALSARLIAIQSLEASGDQPAALVAYEALLPQCEQGLPVGNQITLIVLSGLGKLYQGANQFDRALVYAKKAYDTAVAVIGPTHFNTLNFALNLADIYNSLGEVESAVALLDPIIQDRAQSRISPQAMYRARLLRGTAETIAGRFDTAGRQFESLVPEMRLKLGPTHAYTLQATNWWLSDLAAQRDGDRADELAREAVTAVRARRRTDDAELANLLVSYGDALLRSGRATEAEPMFRECLAIREKRSPDQWNTFNTRSLLGESLHRQGKYADAEPLLLAGYAGLKAREGRMSVYGKAQLPEAADRLIALYDATNRPAEAAKWRAERRLYPPERLPEPRAGR